MPGITGGGVFRVKAAVAFTYDLSKMRFLKWIPKMRERIGLKPISLQKMTLRRVGKEEHNTQYTTHGTMNSRIYDHFIIKPFY